MKSLMRRACWNQQRGLETLDQWLRKQQLDVAEETLLERLRQNIQRRAFMQDVLHRRRRHDSSNARISWIQSSTACFDLKIAFLPVSFICRLILENQTSLIWPSATPRGQNATPMESLAPFL